MFVTSTNMLTFYFFGSFSNALAICSTVRSSYMRPTIIIPHGSPSENPAFIVRAGCPVLSNGAVFLTILKDKSNASVNKKPNKSHKTRINRCH